MFERWLPLHLRIEGNMALRDLLSLAAQEQGQAEDWQHYYPAEQAVRPRLTGSQSRPLPNPTDAVCHEAKANGNWKRPLTGDR